MNQNQAGAGARAAAAAAAATTGQTLGSDETETQGDGGAAAPSSRRLGGLRSAGGLNGQDSQTTSAMDSSAHSETSFTAPPYWQSMPSRRRAASTQSSDSGRPSGTILLLDNEADDDEEDRNNACWAKSVEIVDHTIVNGGATSIGAFVVWNVRVETLQVRTNGRSLRRAILARLFVVVENHDGNLMLTQKTM